VLVRDLLADAALIGTGHLAIGWQAAGHDQISQAARASIQRLIVTTTSAVR
jgi:hypothetical protein